MSAGTLKDKNASTASNAMNGILKNLPTPEILITDDGGEFIFKPFENLTK